jgi:hypothetical protein
MGTGGAWLSLCLAIWIEKQEEIGEIGAAGASHEAAALRRLLQLGDGHGHQLNVQQPASEAAT